MPPRKNNGKKGKAAAAAAAPLASGGKNGAPVKVSERTCTGQLVSRPPSKDIKFETFSLSYYGEDLIKVFCKHASTKTHLLKDTTLELNYGRRYGLIGRNGSGKSTFLKALAARDVAIPEHIDVHLLHEEIAPTEMTALEVRM